MRQSIKEFFCSESFSLALFCVPGAALGSYLGGYLAQYGHLPF